MTNNESIHERISRMVEHFCNGKNTQFAALLGTNEANIRGYRSGTMPKCEILSKIARTFDVDTNWLLTGNGDMIRSGFRNRLSYILLILGVDKSANILGVDKYELIDYCNGGAQPAKKLLFDNLFEAFPFSPDWLHYGIGNRYLNGTDSENENRIREVLSKEHIEENNEAIREYLEQPTINQDFTGSPYFNVDFIGGFDVLMNDQTTNPDFYINYPPYNKEGVMWVNITGKSMEPELSNGDIIAIKEMNTPIQYLPTKEIYAIVTEDYRTVKRIELSDRDGFVRLIPSNKEYQVQEIPTNMITKVYAVLGSIRKFF